MRAVRHSWTPCLAASLAVLEMMFAGAASADPLAPSDDDYAAITAAIANAADGGEVLLGAGTFTITNEIAISRGVTVRGASRDGTIVDCASKCRAFVLSVTGATVADLTVYCGKGISRSGGGVSMSQGLVTNCLIKSCTASNGHGGGIYMTNGTVADCEFTGCSFSSLYYQGNALYLSGGTVTGCDFHDNNYGYPHYNPSYGSHAVYVGNGTLKNSRIHDNKTYLAGLKQANGTVVNCLIYNNTTIYHANCNAAAGVYKTNGTMLYCTIFGNVNTLDTTGCSGIAQTSGTTRYCISYGNGPDGSTYGSNRIMGGTFEKNVVDKGLSLYASNVTGNPGFVASAENDFRIAHSTSPAVGYGIPVTQATDDFDGTVRDLTAPTVGACEYTHAIVTIPELPFVYANGTKQVASIESCADYTVVENKGGTEPGSYPVVLALAESGSTWADGTTANKTLQFTILAQMVLHETDGYEEIVAAMADVGDGETILFADGTYTITNTIVLSRPITLKGESRDGVILDFASKCRGVEVTHASAVLDSLTVYRAKKSGAHGGGLYISNGLVTNCLFKSCVASKMNYGGGGAYVTGGKVIDSEFTKCTFENLYGHGNALYITDGGLVSGCDIHHNDGGYSHGSSLHGDTVVYIVNGGTIEKSKVHHNTKSDVPGILVESSGGTVRNCLVYANSGNYGSAGIYLRGGTVLYTTVYGNVISGETSGISGLRQTGGTVRNSIFYGNGPTGGTAGSCNVSGGTFVTNVIDKALSSYPNNRAADPMFVDVSSDNYLISSRASAAYGYATPLASVTADIIGFARHEERPTCGAYEYDISGEKYGADIKIVQTDYLVGSTAELEATVSGAELDEVDIEWYLDGKLLADETSELLSLSNLSLGHHTVKVVVTRRSNHEATQKEVVDALSIRPLTTYVNTWGAGEYPYATAETATNSINAAVAAVWTDLSHTSVVHVAEGSYTNTATVTIQDKIRILGAGRDVTTFVNKSTWAFALANAAAELCDIAVCNSYAGISVSAGSVHDFKLASNSNSHTEWTSAGIVVSGSARVWNGDISDCFASGIYAGGGGLHQTGGTVSNLVIRRCFGSNHLSTGCGGAVYLTGGTLRDSVVCGSRQYESRGLAILGRGGLLDHCVFTNNAVTSRGCAVQFALIEGQPGSKGVTARNCLFALNSQPNADWASVILSGGTFENCTFAANASPTKTLSASSITARNTIFAETGGATNVLEGTFSHCCAPSLVDGENGNLSAAPHFKTGGRTNWHLLRSSPGVDAGDNSVSSAAAPTDLDGNPRIHGGNLGVVDMGCYENPLTGLMLIVK